MADCEGLLKVTSKDINENLATTDCPTSCSSCGNLEFKYRCPRCDVVSCRFFYVQKPGAAMRRHVVMGDIAIPVGVSTTPVVEFSKSDPIVFSLAEVFRVQLTCGTTLEVVLEEEDVIIHSLYTDSSFYTLVSQEFCLLFDIMYAKTGTEAVAESFYRVVEKQEMEGKQSLDDLAVRLKVDLCLPPVLQCDSALTEMAQMYIEGDKKLGLKKHVTFVTF